MLTINYNGKTYRPTPLNISKWKKMVDSGIFDTHLEEVEEKPEEKRAQDDIDRRMGDHMVDRRTHDGWEPPSILEKLREEMERKVQQTIEQIEKTQQIRDCERLNTLREILDLLTSLETPQAKKSDIPSREYMDKMCIPEQPQFTPGQKVSIHNPICSSGSSSTADKWTPTPGQMIEVRGTENSEWVRRKFIGMQGDGQYLTADENGVSLRPYFWQFARPIKIEPELPEFNYEKLEENIRDVEFEKLDELRHMIGHIGKQTEALTKAVQALARQKPTK